MRIVAYFEDSSEMMAHNAKHEPAHLAYLKTNQTEIPISGGLRPEPGGKFVGGLWVQRILDTHHLSLAI